MLNPMLDLPFQPITWGAEPHDFTEQTAGGVHALNLNVYTVEDTQRYICGTRSMTWDGRVFKYAKVGAAGIPYNCYAAKNSTILIACYATTGSSIAVTLPTAVAGATSFVVTFGTGTLANSTTVNMPGRDGVLAENELCGGYISLHTGNYRQQRMIIGNSETDGNSEAMTIYIDAPLHHAISSASKCEILGNPFMNVVRSNDTSRSAMGMPNEVAISGEFIWLQTWGPMVVGGTGGPYGGVNEREWVFDNQGAVIPAETDSGTISYQHAGYIIESSGGAANQGAPFINLQVNI